MVRRFLKIIGIPAILLMCSWLLVGMAVQGIVVGASEGPSRLEVVIAPNPIIAEGSENGVIFVSLQDSMGRPVPASREIALKVSSSDLGVGKISPRPWSIAKGEYYGRVDFSCTRVIEYEPKFIETYRTGSTTITASADGLVSGQAILTTVTQGGSASRLRTFVGVPKISLSDNLAPIQVQVLDIDGRPTRPEISFEVTLSASPDLIEFSSRSWRWGRDFIGYVNCMEDYVKGRVPGLARVTASAAGFASESANIEVVSSEITATATATSTYTSASLATPIVDDFDFAVSVEPGSSSVVAGGLTTFTATVRLIRGSPRIVDLSAVGLPLGANASFNPSSVLPTAASEVRIRVSSEVPSGTYKVTFLAQSGELRRTTVVDLVVSGGGCLIATATYGSELAPEVQFLREFRDERIMWTFAGSSFMAVFNAWYYSFSPRVATYIWEHQAVRQSMRIMLWPMMGILHLSSIAYFSLEFEPELAALVSGILASSLTGLLYLSLPVTGLLRLLGRRIDARVIHRIMKWLGMLMVILLTGFTVSQFFSVSQMMRITTAGIVLTSLSFGSILLTLLITGRRSLAIRCQKNRDALDTEPFAT